jgi:hypothetical protein
MSSESRIQIAPGVVFSATVFTPVQLSRCTSVDRDTQHPDSRRPAVDPRQIDLWADDVRYAPQADAQQP